MEKMRFRVEATCRERTIYVVEARDAEEARRLAARRWHGSEPGDIAGFDWRELATMSAAPAPDLAGERQDDELVLRFIRERERLLTRLQDSLVGPPLNDSISAMQAALDLGWYRPDGGDTPILDTVRAAEALERLCDRRLLISFRRTRVRTGERGEIVLYCTPEHLERLSDALDDSIPATAAIL
jgi:hypothetical protein